MNTLKYRNLILFSGDKIFCKQSVIRDNSLHLIFIPEAATSKFSSTTAFGKVSSNSYVTYEHFVT